MKKNQKGFSTLVIVIVAIIICVVIGIGIFVFKRAGSTTISNDGFVYEIELPNSKVQIKNGINMFVTADEKISVWATPSSSNKQYKCSISSPKVDTVTINGNSYDLCYSSAHKLYVSSFVKDNQWHYIDIIHQNDISIDEIKTIASSVKVL